MTSPDFVCDMFEVSVLPVHFACSDFDVGCKTGRCTSIIVDVEVSWLSSCGPG